MGVIAGLASEACGAACNVARDLVIAFCCLERRNIDFQQANGRSVDVVSAMCLWCRIHEAKLELRAKSRVACDWLIGSRPLLSDVPKIPCQEIQKHNPVQYQGIPLYKQHSTV